MTEDDAPLTARWMVRQYGFDRDEDCVCYKLDI